MTKKSLSVAALFSAAVLGGAFFATSNNASATTVDKPYSQDGNAYVSFTKTKPNGPIDHSDGSTSNPNSDDSTTDTGDLTLDAIPGTLNFGDHDTSDTSTGVDFELLPSTKADGLAKTGNREGDQHQTSGTEDWIYTQVTNLDATKPQWTLGVKLGTFKNLDDGKSNTLEGATIKFGSEASQLLDPSATHGWSALNQGITDFTLTAGGADVKYVNSTQTGTTQQAWQAKNVILHVAKDQQLTGDYAATMTWTLSATAPTSTTPTPDTTDTGDEG